MKLDLVNFFFAFQPLPNINVDPWEKPTCAIIIYSLRETVTCNLNSMQLHVAGWLRLVSRPTLAFQFCTPKSGRAWYQKLCEKYVTVKWAVWKAGAIKTRHGAVHVPLTFGLPTLDFHPPATLHLGSTYHMTCDTCRSSHFRSMWHWKARGGPGDKAKIALFYTCFVGYHAVRVYKLKSSLWDQSNLATCTLYMCCFFCCVHNLACT